MGFKYNQKGLAYFIHSLTIAPMGISYHTELYYKLQSLQFSKTVDDLPVCGNLHTTFWYDEN